MLNLSTGRVSEYSKKMKMHLFCKHVPVQHSKHQKKVWNMYKLTIKTPERRRSSGVFIVNFEHTSHLALVFLLLTLNRLISSGS